jgi:hypothetical protein
MRMIAIVAIMFATVLTDGADAAPWCAQYGTGGTNCGFHSFEQCLAARSGNGGFCSENSFENPSWTGGERWSRKSEQGDKWSFCLTAGTLCPANQERP